MCKPAEQNPLIVIGQDKAIFKQFISLWKVWITPDGKKMIDPKDDGVGVLVSAMMS